MKNTVDADYSTIPAGGFLERILTSQRRKMFDAFTLFIQGNAGDSVLHVGMRPTPLFDNTNYLLAWSDPHSRSRITSCEIELRDRARADMTKRSRQVHGLDLPFADGEFDWVFGNEVIEHAGSFERQYALLKELTRVARKGVFVTTSNRRHPIEFYTAIPVLHWLPDAWWRRILKWSGKSALASESVLNLLDSHALYKLASLLPGKPKHDVGHKRVFGIKAHFFLMVQKNAILDKAEKKKVEEMPGP